MKQILVTFLLALLYNISSAQSGWGYVNYTSYKTHNGNGSTSQYDRFPYTAAEFDNMLNTANSNTTITHTGEVPLSIMCDGSTQTPHWGGDFYAIKFEFWFVPQETGTYTFGINSDDASDLSVAGTIITTYYGGHGASAYQYGTINLVAGTRYKVVARYQEYGGGDALFVRWSRPSAPFTYSYWANEVTNIAVVPTKQAIANFNFGNILDETKFSASALVLGSNGRVDITNALDSTKIASGYKAIIAASNWESVIINPYESNINGHRLLLDERMFNSSSPKFNNINSVEILDIYNGPITVYDTSGWWKTYIIPGNIANKITSSTYQSSLRLQDGWYAIQAGTNITYTEITEYNPQSITITTTNTLSSLYNSIVTVSDVYLAFKELSNSGLFGNQTGNEFGYGIQYKNADINEDGVFNEADCFRLLQHLTGVKGIVDTVRLNNTLRIIPQSTYNTITKSNWNTFPSYLGDTYSFNINTGKAIDTLNLSGTWKGDVNLSHSATPVITNMVASIGIRAFSTSVPTQIQASIITEMIDDVVYANIKIDPLQQELVGTQFKLNYDNSLLKFEKIEFKTKGLPTNYGTDKGDYINFGSLITDGSTLLDNTTEYTLVFTPKTKLNNILGLISVYVTDAVSRAGKPLKIKMN
jgi:hypothetical protein